MTDLRPYVDQRVVELVDAARVAATAAAAWQLPAPTLLRSGMNAIYVCDGEVIRVGRATAPARASHDLASFLLGRDLPVVASVPGHSMDLDGFAVTGWQRIRAVDAPVDWEAVGAAVARLHGTDAALLPAAYPVPSPTTFPWWDFDELLSSVADGIDRAALAGLERTIRAGAGWQSAVAEGAVLCHGDVHPGNVLTTAAGPVLIDFDLMCRAAPAWDHAMLTTYAARWGGDAAAYPAFAAGYGRSFADDELTVTLASLRNVAATLMRVRAGLTDETARAEAERRLRYWRGEPDAPQWRAQ